MLTLKDWGFVTRRILLVALFWGAAVWYAQTFHPEFLSSLAGWLNEHLR